MDNSARVAVVTGASQGIGRRTAEVLAGKGYALALNDIQSTRARWKRSARSARRPSKFAATFRARPTSIASPGPSQQHYGRVDVLVNNAGISFIRPAEDTGAEEWRRVLEVNLTGPFLLCRAFGKLMLERGEGAIVNVASVAGLAGIGDRAAYNASKHGLIGLTRTLASEWGGRGVRTNAVCPGWVKTEMDEADQAGGSYSDADIENRVPMARFARPTEIAEAIAFLADPKLERLHQRHGTAGRWRLAGRRKLGPPAHFPPQERGSFIRNARGRRRAAARHPGPRPEEVLRSQSRRRRSRPGGAARVVLRLSGSERRGQVHHHPHAHRADPLRQRLGGNARAAAAASRNSKSSAASAWCPTNRCSSTASPGAEFLEFVGRMYGLGAARGHRARAAACWTSFELHADRKMIAEYSKGMRKRVAMAASLIHHPELFLMDEPFEGVDAVGARLMKDILLDQVRRGATIFLTSHVLEVVERLCDRVAIINEGRIAVCRRAWRSCAPAANRWKTPSCAWWARSSRMERLDWL